MLNEARRDEAAGRVEVHAVELGDLALGAPAPVGELGGAPKSSGRGFGEGEARDPSRVGTTGEQIESAVAAQETGHHRLGGRRGSAHDCPLHVVGAGHQRRDEQDEAGVDPIVAQQRLEGLLVLLRGRGCHQVHRVGDAGGGREEAAQRLLGALAEFGHLESRRDARIGGEDAGSPTVRDDRDVPADRKWLVENDRGDIEELFERVDPDHPGLAEQCVDGDVWCRERRRV